MKKLATLAGTAGLVFTLGSAVSAQTTYSGDEENPAVLETELPAAPAPAPTPAVNDAVTAAPTNTVAAKQQLPVTGGEAASLALLGTALVAGGGLLVWRSKGIEATA